MFLALHLHCHLCARVRTKCWSESPLHVCLFAHEKEMSRFLLTFVLGTEGNNENATLLGALCGTTATGFSSRGRHMFIRFLSNSQTTDDGFKLVYFSVIGEVPSPLQQILDKKCFVAFFHWGRGGRDCPQRLKLFAFLPKARKQVS